MKKKQNGGDTVWNSIKNFAKKHKTTIAITLGVLAIIGGGVATKKYIDKKKHERELDKKERKKWLEREQAVDTLRNLTGMDDWDARRRIKAVRFQHGSEGVKDFIRGHDNHAKLIIDAGKINRKARKVHEDKKDDILETVHGLMEKLQENVTPVHRVGGKRRSSKRRRSKKQRSKRRRSKKR
jgi:hypothetical protein